MNDSIGYNAVDKNFNLKQDFKCEKDLSDYLEINIKSFVNDILGLNFMEYERESYIKYKPFGRNVTRIDFLVTTTDGEKILIEVKNPKNKQRELNRSITQLLDYYIICERANLKINSTWLVTTKIDESIINIINRFDLPINICVMNKNQFAIWKKGDDNIASTERK